MMYYREWGVLLFVLEKHTEMMVAVFFFFAVLEICNTCGVFCSCFGDERKIPAGH